MKSNCTILQQRPFRLMNQVLMLILLATSNIAAQDDGCDKCSMLQEEYEAAVSPEKEKIYAFFKEECLNTDTVFVTDKGTVEKQSEATAFQVVAKGKCIDYQEVKEYEKASKKETRSYRVTKKDTIYTFASSPAVFPGGDVELVKYLSTSIRYPAEALNKKIQGTVYVRFVVTKEGGITGMKVIRSPDPELSREALRVVKTMPKWTPARYKKEAVSMMYVLPVKFRLQ